MSDRDLRMQVVFSALDKLTGPLKKITGGSGEAAKALKATSDRLRELNAQQKNLNDFQKLKAGLRSTSVELRNAQQNAKAIGNQLVALKAQTDPAAGAVKKLTAEHKKSLEVVDKLNNAYRTNLVRNREMATSLAASGINVRKKNTITQAQTWLSDSIAFTNVEMASQKKRLAELGAAHQAYESRLSGARQRADKMRSVAGNAAMAGIGATTAGAVLGAPVVKGLKEAKHYQTEVGRVGALGLGDKVSAEAVAFARNMKTYGTSQLDNLALMRDGMTAFADVHHAEMVAPTLAKMKFANKAFFGEEHGADNERKFMDMLKVIELRGGLESKEKFEAQANIVQKVITATGGRVGPNEWLNMIKTGGIAAKGLKDESFYYQMEPLVQEMGGNRVGTSLMSAYQNLYQGRTTKRAALKLEEFGLIGDQSKVTHDKAGQMSFLNPGALLGADLFRTNQFEWMEKILLPQLAKKGITEQSQILDAIGSIFSNRTGSNLYGQMVMQRVQIHKNEQLNKGAADINTLDKLGRDQASGKEMEVEAKLADLKLTMGEKILPLYARGLEMVISAVQSLNGFMERNPATAKIMIVSFALLAGMLVVLGPLMLAIAAMVGPYAMLYVMFAKMGIQGGVLTPILRGLGSSLLWVGRAVAWLGRAFLMNPIGLAVTAIAVSAYLIYQYWEPISNFFAGLWGQIKTAFSGGILGVTALLLNWSPLGLLYQVFAGVMSWLGIDLPAKFTDFGLNIMRGLVNGISNGLNLVKTTILDAGSSTIAWFKDKLGIKSPSRVFAELGDFTMQGLAIGLNRSEDAPLGQVSGLARRLTQLGAGIAIGAAAMPASAFDTRPPLSQRGHGGVIVQGDTIQITIEAQPGADADAIARAVYAAMERRDREKKARLRSSLYDHE